MKIKNLVPENKFVLKYYLSGFLEGSYFIGAFLSIILNNSLTPFQVAVVFGVSSIAQLLFEIPTGALADRFGRKNVLIIGIILFIISFFLLLFERSFIECLISFILRGVCIALFSGAFQSLIYDNMKHYKIDKNFAEYKGKRDLSFVIAYSLSAFVASVIVKFYNYDVLIGATIVPAFLYLVNILSIQDFYAKNENLRKISNDYFKILKNAFKYSIRHTTIFKFIIFSSFWFGLLPIVINYDGLYISKITGKPAMTGLLVGIQSSVVSIGQFLFIKKLSKVKTYKIFLLFGIGSFALQVAYMLFDFPVSFILSMFYFVCEFLSNSILRAREQKYIPSKIRATVLSLEGFVIGIFNVVYYTLFGVVAQKFSYKTAYNLYAFLQICICVIFFVVLSLDKHLRKRERRLK